MESKGSNTGAGWQEKGLQVDIKVTKGLLKGFENMERCSKRKVTVGGSNYEETAKGRREF